MLNFIRKFFKPEVQPLNSIKISRNNILDNIKLIQQIQPHQAIFPVLKSNAYGHGILQMIEILEGGNFPYIAVDSFPEWQIINKNSNFSVLVMGETLSHNYRYYDTKKTAFAIFTKESLQALAKLKKKIRIHLFINTGMNREGIQEKYLPYFLTLLKQYPQIELEGIMSHFHSADTNIEKTKEQILLFKKMTKTIYEAGFSPKWKHISASAGIINIQDDFFTAVRAGLLLYGYSPLAEGEKTSITEQLKPALDLYSHIIALQQINKGEGISYNQERVTEMPIKTATVPFGYYEGRPRSLSGKLSYLYRGQEITQLGKICMNISCCLGNGQMKIGDIIQLISKEKHSKASITHIAKLANTIPYEILIRLDRGIRREIV